MMGTRYPISHRSRPPWKLGQRAGRRALYVGVKYVQKSPKPVAGSSSPVARCVNNLGQMVCMCAAAAAAYVYKYVCCVLDIYEIFSTLAVGVCTVHVIWYFFFFWSAVYRRPVVMGNNNIYIQRSREEKSKLITKSIFILMGKKRE